MTGPASRRSFLHGLTTPLVGGGVALIGAPSAVAEPITPDLLVNYETFLSQELRRLSLESRGDPNGAYVSTECPAWFWSATAGNFYPPSTRAALVLSAVGCDWREGPRWA